MSGTIRLSVRARSTIHHPKAGDDTIMPAQPDSNKSYCLGLPLSSTRKATDAVIATVSASDSSC